MILQTFAIYDSKAATYSPPFSQKTLGLAIRMFSDSALDKTTTIGLHPEDFILFHLGEYDDQTGKQTDLNAPLSIVSAQETIPTED